MRIKQAFFNTIIVLFVVLVVEAFSAITFDFLYGRYDSQSLSNSKQQAIDALPVLLGESKGSVSQQKKEIHPYVGYTHPKFQQLGCDQAKNFCFSGLANFEQLQAGKSQKDFIIAITGGSVAAGMRSSLGWFSRYLDLANVTKGKRVVFVFLAIPGHKQPQQLLAFSYALSQGLKPDLLINFDGFNEIAVAATNYKRGFYSRYPQVWEVIVNASLKPEDMVLLFDHYKVQQSLASWARWASANILHRSRFVNLLWKFKQSESMLTLAESQQKIEVHFAAKSRGKGENHPNAPAERYSSMQDFYQQAAHHWATSSILMSQLAKSNDIEYVHFLQPNQYVTGSKPLSGAELKLYDSTRGYGLEYSEGNVELRKQGEKLAQSINFFDYSMLFAGDAETLYVDSCCHLNRKGYKLIVNAMAEKLGQIIEP